MERPDFLLKEQKIKQPNGVIKLLRTVNEYKWRLLEYLIVEKGILPAVPCPEISIMEPLYEYWHEPMKLNLLKDIAAVVTEKDQKEFDEDIEILLNSKQITLSADKKHIKLSDQAKKEEFLRFKGRFVPIQSIV